MTATLLAVSAATAQERSAREHFERGYAAVQRGDLELASSEFEQAYRKSPNFSVLYNLGQVYASAGRSVEAVDTLERYLELGGTAIPAERRALVEALIGYHSQRVAELEIDAPPGSELHVDGRHVGTAPLPGPVRVVAGRHALSVTRPGYVPEVRTLTLAGRQRRRVSVDLAALPAARVAVRCGVPDVSVYVDERPVATTPLRRALEVSPGEHRLSFRRAGYVGSAPTFVVPAGGSITVTCELSPHANQEQFAALAVQHPVGTRVLVDGSAFRGGRLPPGRHTVAVLGDGYEALERVVALPPNGSRRLALVPSPSAVRRERESEGKRALQRQMSIVVGGAGAAAAASAGILYVANNERYEDWRAESRRFVADYAREPGSAPPARLDRLLDDERALRNRDAIALGLAISAGALVVGAITLYLTAEPSQPELTLTARGLEQLELGVWW